MTYMYSHYQKINLYVLFCSSFEKKKTKTFTPHRNAEKMIENSLERSIVREQKYLARKKIRRNKTNNCEIIFDSHQFKEVESFKTYASSY